MKISMYKVMAALACAAILAACGGGANDTTTTPTPPQPAFKWEDIDGGSGTRVAAAGDLVTVTYEGWLYDANKDGNKGAQFESTNGIPAAMSLGFGTTRLVGWDKGLLGMKVGGKRKLLIPASMAFGAAGLVKDGKTLVPADTAVVYEMTMLSIATVPTNLPPQPLFTKTDTTVGTGTEAAANHLVGIRYTGYLYDETKADKKGAQFETTGTGAPFTFLLGVNSRIPGWEQGILGMKVGGKRTLLIPSGMAYSFRGREDVPGTILVPAHTAVVYDIELTSLVTTPPVSTVQPAFTKIDTRVGTGTREAAATDRLTVHYTGYLYNDSVTDKRGLRFETSLASGNALEVKKLSEGVIAGWSQGLIGVRAGGKRTLIIPANLAYGANAQGSIPANSALIFDIEVLTVNP
ncbi:FKBP-type peptidyl-prolyl cis-trans isomerase [Pseudoduganella sp.]|uniref:FKBP-type peptidyl-prolyl cis-trans isomerase n=1 Tax=Pseudoduganella sp. TaxID=1880898 RepID=UPI0035B3B64F